MDVKVGKRKVISNEWKKNYSGKKNEVKLGKKKVISNKWR